MEFTKSFKNSSADDEGNRDKNETGANISLFTAIHVYINNHVSFGEIFFNKQITTIQVPTASE